jgi:hypothetical protein
MVMVVPAKAHGLLFSVALKLFQYSEQPGQMPKWGHSILSGAITDEHAWTCDLFPVASFPLPNLGEQFHAFYANSPSVACGTIDARNDLNLKTTTQCLDG